MYHIDNETVEIELIFSEEEYDAIKLAAENNKEDIKDFLANYIYEEFCI